MDMVCAYITFWREREIHDDDVTHQRTISRAASVTRKYTLYICALYTVEYYTSKSNVMQDSQKLVTLVIAAPSAISPQLDCYCCIAGAQSDISQYILLRFVKIPLWCDNFTVYNLYLYGLDANWERPCFYVTQGMEIYRQEKKYNLLNIKRYGIN